MALYLPVRAVSRSQAVRIGKQTVKTGTTTYVDVSSQVETGGIKAGSTLPYSPFKELQNHLAIGAIIVVGPLTATNSDWVVDSGGIVTVEKSEAKKEPELAVSENQDRQRSTGKWVTSEKVEKLKLKVTGATKERIDLVYAIVEGGEAGKVKAVEGVAAAKEAAVAPATPAKSIPLATVKQYNEEEIKAANITDDRPRP